MILITGATGTIGGELVKQLAATGTGARPCESGGTYHREINGFLARKICRDLQAPETQGQK